MKHVLVTLLIATASPLSAGGLAPELASCDLAMQRVIPGELSDAVTDERQAHVHRRVDILRGDLATAQARGWVSSDRADDLLQRLVGIRAEADNFTRSQGFLSAAERASYDRNLDNIAQEICR